MSEMEKILLSKSDFRRKLAALPIAQKLALLDVLRERTLACKLKDVPLAHSTTKIDAK